MDSTKVYPNIQKKEKISVNVIRAFIKTSRRLTTPKGVCDVLYIYNSSNLASKDLGNIKSDFFTKAVTLITLGGLVNLYGKGLSIDSSSLSSYSSTNLTVFEEDDILYLLRMLIKSK